MLIDAQLVLIDNATLTATGSGTNVIDFGVARDPGSGEPLWVVITFGTVSGTSPTFIAALKADTVVGMGSAITKFTSPTLTVVSNSQYAFRVPAGVPRQFWRLDYTIAGTTPSMVTNASFVKDVELKLHSRQLVGF